jgi:hypothetical protein
MSFLDSLFGGADKKRDLTSANATATNALNQSRTAQLAALSGGVGQARSDIQGGMDGAITSLNRGYDTARGDLTTNYGNAEGAINSGMDRARGLLNPMITLGGQYDKMYADAIGVNGGGARTAFYDRNVRNNQDFAYADELAAKQQQAKLNAAGITGGRAGSLMLRQGAQRIEDRTNQYLDRIAQQGARGAQTATTLAGMEGSAGSQIAGIRTGLGDRLSGLETGRGSALGNVQMQGGQMLSNVGLDNARAIAGVEGNYGQGIASNAINYGNGVASLRGSGLNTMMRLAGIGIQGFTPGRTGVTPFENMANGIGRAASSVGGMFDGGAPTMQPSTQPVPNINAQRPWAM